MELEFGANSRFGRFSLKKAKFLVNHALSIGIKRFDTGFTYGNFKTQPLLAKCLETKISNSREEVSISTKCSPVSDEYIDYCVKKSIETFNCSYLDNFHLWGASIEILENKKIVSKLKLLKEAGLVKLVSVNTHQLSLIKNISSRNFEEIDGLLIDYNFLLQNRIKYIRESKRNNLKIFAGTTLCQGFLLSSILKMFLRTKSPFYLARAILNKDTRRYLDKAKKFRKYINLNFPEIKMEIPLSFIANEKAIDFVPIGMMSKKSLDKNKYIIQNPINKEITDLISKWALKNCQLDIYDDF